MYSDRADLEDVLQGSAVENTSPVARRGAGRRSAASDVVWRARSVLKTVLKWSRRGRGGLLWLVLLSGCDRLPWQDPPSDVSEEETATAVVVQELGRGPLEARIEASSTIEAERQVTVHAEASGRLVELSVEEGQAVRAGARIGRIRAEAQAAGLDRASTQLEQTRRDLETVERLLAQGVASKDEHTRAKLAYETAVLDVRDRRRDVGNAIVTAPLAGTITERMVSQGAYVTVGQPLVTVVDFGSLVARVFIPEKELDRVALGQPAKIRGKAVRSRQGEGTVTRIAPVVDAATGTIKVTVGLPPEGGASPTFLPGMYATLELTTDRREHALRVPKRALVREDDGAFVFTVVGDRANRVDLALGLEDGEWAEVVSGLEEGSAVVVEGQSGLKDGALIRRVDPVGKAVARAAEGTAEGV